MQIRYIQTVVTQEEYREIAKCALEEELSLSDFIAKTAREYLEKRSNNEKPNP